MALLGSSVDPRLFMQDYSGFTRAAEIQAQGMQNLGAAIGQGIKDFGEARQERKKLDAQIKADSASIESAMKLGDSLGIDIKSYLAPIQAKINDPNTTPMEAAAYGRAASQGISNAFTLGIGAQERQSAAERARIDAQYKNADLALKGERVDIARMQAEKGPTPKFELLKPQITSPTGEVFEGPELPYDVNRGMFFDTKVQKHIKDVNLIGTGKEYAPESAMPTPTSQVGDGASDLIASAAQMNIGKLSTAKTPGTQGGNVGCADAICRTFEMATGEELVPGGTLSTREMATNLNNDPRFVKVPFNKAQKGDIVLTPRKGSKAGHTGIVLDGGKIASNSSRGFAGKSPGTFTQNYTMDSWNRNVAPRNPSETAAYRYVGSQGIDNALAMGGDMTQQAMGTPEQQAMLSQQIEQGAGMATAQNVPQGAMPTEPSMATQQPQLPQQAAPQWSPPPGFAPVKPKGNKPTTTMTAEQVQNLAAQGFRVNAIPNADGSFNVSGVTVGGQSGTTFDFDPKTGRVIVTQGGSKAGQTAKAEEKTKAAATGLTQDLYALKDRYTALSAGTGPIPALSRLGASAVPGSPANEVSEIARRVTSGLTIEKIMSERRSNASGAALGGSTSDKDMKILESATTSLNAAQNPEAFNREWTRIMEAQLNIAYGTPEQRANLVNEDKITEQYNKQVEDLYPDETINMKGQLVPRAKTTTSNVKSPITSETQAILDRYGKGQ